MPDVLTEGPHGPDFLLSEASGWLSRDKVTVTVPANTTLLPGTVLEVSGAVMVKLTGSTNAAAVLYSELVNNTGSPVDKPATVINRAAEVRLSSLVWPDGWVAANYAASLTALRALAIKARS